METWEASPLVPLPPGRIVLPSPKLTSVGRRHRGQTGDRALGCSWLRGWSVTGLEGPQKPVSPPTPPLHIKAQRGQCPCPWSHSKLVADRGTVLRAPTSQPGLFPGSLKPLKKHQALRFWGRGRLGRWQWRLRLGRVSRAPGREEIPGREEFLPRGSTCHLYFSHQVAPDPHLCHSLAQAGEGAEDRGSLPLANTF